MYITEEQLKGFDSYKYSCIDTSPLSKYVMHPFWNQFVKIFPKWVAPNVMTFGGFMLLVILSIILSIYDPVLHASTPEMTEYAAIPTWVWWFSCLTQFFSHTLDGIDGKQARRTGSSSPLGELFDHGLDSLCVSMFTVCFFSLFGRGVYGATAWEYYIIYWIMLFCFVLSHFEKYNTGVLYLPWSYDASQVVMALGYLMGAVVGVQFCSFDIGDKPLGFYLKLFVIYAVPSVCLVVSLYNVYRSYADKTGKMRTFYEAMIPLFSPVVAFVLITTWCALSPYDILQKQPRWVFLASCVVFSNIVCRLIVSQMSNTRCQVLNYMLLPLAISLAANLYMSDPLIEFWIFRIMTVFLTLLHIHYGVTVVNELADHFGIRVFLIRKPEHKHVD